MDERSQSVAIGAATATIVSLGIFYLLAQEFFDPIYSENQEIVTNSTAQQGADWVFLGLKWYLALALGVIIIGTIATAAYQRQGGRL